MNEYIILSYFGVNLFLAGYSFRKEWEWSRERENRIFAIVWSLLTLLFGIPYLIFIFIFKKIKYLLFKYYQLKI